MSAPAAEASPAPTAGMVTMAPATAGPPAVAAEKLAKRYGRARVLDDVTFRVGRGEVFALAGPNGSGKTTLIRLLTGLSFPTSGTARLLGRDVHAAGANVRRALGAVVEAPAAFYPHLSGRDNLRAHARLAGGTGWLPDGRPGLLLDDARVREVLTLVELLRIADRPVREYSLGQRQRLGLAAAIIANPRVLILDEPTSGLDPLGIGLVHRVLSSMAAAGTAVILSTHHLREVSAYAHRVGILGAGRLLDDVNLLERQAAYRFRVDDPARAVVALATRPFVSRVYARAPYAVAHLEGEAKVPDVLNALGGEDVRVFEAAQDHFDLYDYYRERVQSA